MSTPNRTCSVLHTAIGDTIDMRKDAVRQRRRFPIRVEAYSPRTDNQKSQLDPAFVKDRQAFVGAESIAISMSPYASSNSASSSCCTSDRSAQSVILHNLI